MVGGSVRIGALGADLRGTLVASAVAEPADCAGKPRWGALGRALRRGALRVLGAKGLCEDAGVRGWMNATRLSSPSDTRPPNSSESPPSYGHARPHRL